MSTLQIIVLLFFTLWGVAGIITVVIVGFIFHREMQREGEAIRRRYARKGQP